MAEEHPQYFGCAYLGCSKFLKSGSKQICSLRNCNSNIILTEEIPKHEDLDKGIKQMKDSTHRLKTDSS